MSNREVEVAVFMAKNVHGWPVETYGDGDWITHPDAGRIRAGSRSYNPYRNIAQAHETAQAYVDANDEWEGYRLEYRKYHDWPGEWEATFISHTLYGVQLTRNLPSTALCESLMATIEYNRKSA